MISLIFCTKVKELGKCRSLVRDIVDFLYQDCTKELGKWRSLVYNSFCMASAGSLGNEWCNG